MYNYLTEYNNTSDERIKKLYSINIVYGSFGQGEDYIYKHQGSFVGNHSKNSLDNKSYTNYYILKINNFDGLIKNTLDEWIYFLKNNEVKDNFKAKGLEEVKEKMRYEKLDKKSKLTYNRFQESIRIEKSAIETAEHDKAREITSKMLVFLFLSFLKIQGFRKRK